MEVSRTLILPDFMPPSAQMLATLALFWESIELPVYYGTSAPAEDEQALVTALIDEGILRLRVVGEEPGVEDAERIEAVEVAGAWARTPPGTTSRTIDMSVAEEIVVARAHRVARSLQDRAKNAMAMASELWAAPVISSPFSLLASSLPMQDVTLPIAEAALIHLAVSGALVDTATPVDRLLTFREKHKDLAGRLRGSLIDLASTIRTDLSTSAVVGQARAVLTNRVEPSLSALESELKKGRISFAWTNMFGVGGLVAGSASVTTASIGGGAFLIGRTVKYAFDRDALVRDHPFGYLHRVRTSLVDGRTDMSHSPYLPLDKPVPDLETLLAKAYLAAFRVDPHSDFMTAVMIGDRTADPASAARYITRRAREKEIPSAWWTDRSV